MTPDLYPTVYGSFRKTLGNEGYARHMYLDDRGLVTTGRGNLIEPVAAAQGLEWLNGDGSIASKDQVATSFAAIQARKDLIPYGGGGQSPQGESFSSVSPLRLSENGVDKLVEVSAESLGHMLLRTLPIVADFPADAQLALLRWTWGNGPNVPYLAPRMTKALTGAVPDFRGAAEESTWTNENVHTAKVIHRLFLNAADVIDAGVDPSELVWPSALVLDGNGAWTMVEEADPDFGVDMGSETEDDPNATFVNDGTGVTIPRAQGVEVVDPGFDPLGIRGAENAAKATLQTLSQAAVDTSGRLDRTLDNIDTTVQTGRQYAMDADTAVKIGLGITAAVILIKLAMNAAESRVSSRGDR